MFLFIDYDSQIYRSLLSLLQVLNCIASSLYIFCNYYILIYILFYFSLLLPFVVVLEIILNCYDKLNKFEEEKFYLKELMLVMKPSGEQLGCEFALSIKLKTNLFSLCSLWCNGSSFIC